jgi:hypothetical protein
MRRFTNLTRKLVFQGLAILVFAVALQLFPANSLAADGDAKLWVRAAAEAMGGEAKLRALKSVKIESIGHKYWLEQSERPEGPWLVDYQQVTEVHDLVGKRLQQTSESKNFQATKWGGATLIYANGVAAFIRGNQFSPVPASFAQGAEEALEFAPERLLLSALEAQDLHAERDVTLQGVSNHLAVFKWKEATVKLFLNVHTALPTAVEVTRAHPYDFYWSVWGDVKTQIFFSLWNLETAGIRYPRQIDTVRNAQPYTSFTAINVAFDVPIQDDAFAIPDGVKVAFAGRKQMVKDLPLGRPNKPAQELAKDIVQIPGAWNVALIKQSDGIVVLEAPIGSGYSEKVLAEIEKRFPATPIKAVITTSDAWPHLGGVREYVARGITVYALDLNQPILERLIASPYAQMPDTLAAKNVRAKMKYVSTKTVLGTGANRLEIYPIRSESGERMLMVYFPEHHLLYGSDLVQGGQGGGFFMPQYLTELNDAVKREGLQVNTVFAMHAPAIEWTKITEAIKQAWSPSPADK